MFEELLDWFCRGVLRRPFAIFGDIYYPDHYWNLPKTRREAIALHEKTHLEQQAKMNDFVWLFLYFLALPLVFSPYRLRWEQEAFAREVKYLKSRGYSVPKLIEDYSRAISGKNYGFMTSQKDAESWLKEILS